MTIVDIILVIYLIGYPFRVLYCYKELNVEKDMYLIKYGMNEQTFKTQVFWISIFVSLIWPFELVGRLIIAIVCWVYNKFNQLVVRKLIQIFDKMISK